MANTLRTQALLWALLVLLAAPARATDSAPDAEAADQAEGLRATAAWGTYLSSQMQRVSPVSFWSVGLHAPLVEALGAEVDLRFDAPALGDPGSPLSVLIQPGRTDYGLAFSLNPPPLPFGLEYHHVSGHEVASLTASQNNRFEAVILEGGASNLFSLSRRAHRYRLRLGWGSLWTDTNTAPMLLGLHGILLNTRAATGPFATLTLERLRWAGFVGRVGAMAMLDEAGGYRNSGDYLAVGATVHRALGPRMVLGISWMQNNGYGWDVGPMSTLSCYLRLRWSANQPLHRPLHRP